MAKHQGGVPYVPSETEQEFTESMLLYRDGDKFVVEVLAYPGCKAMGTSYREAIQRIPDALRRWRHKPKKMQPNAGRPEPCTPSHVLEDLKRFVTGQIYLPPKPSRSNPVKVLLIEKFGNLSNREMAARIGMFGADSPAVFSVATGGRGSQEFRCKIALALGRKPSELWPLNPPHKVQNDDKAYADLIIRETEHAGTQM